MSLILDALNRSRTESGPVPGLDSQPVLPEERSPGVAAHLPWLALGAALVLIAWLLFDRFAGGESVGAKVVAETDAKPALAEQPPAAVAPDKPGPGAVARTDPGAAKDSAGPAAAAGPAPRTDARDAEVARLYAAPRENKSPVARPDAAAGAKESSTTPEKAVKPAARPAPSPVVDVAAMVEMAETEKKNTGLEEHPAPLVVALSQPTKDAIPTLLYERHDYNSVPGRSRVVINGKTLRVGGTAAAGVKVEEILSDSVVLSHKGTQFRLRALNSWVNL